MIPETALTPREIDQERINGDAERRSAEFVGEILVPAIGDAPDGGLALWRAIVDHVFADAAWHDDAGDLPYAAELLNIAQRAIDRVRNPPRDPAPPEPPDARWMGCP